MMIYIVKLKSSLFVILWFTATFSIAIRGLLSIAEQIDFKTLDVIDSVTLHFEAEKPNFLSVDAVARQLICSARNSFAELTE